MTHTKFALIILIGIGFSPMTFAKKADKEKGNRSVASNINRNITLKGTLCSDMLDQKESNSISVSVDGTSKMLTMDKSIAGFVNARIVLMDACSSRKAVDLTYDEVSQKIISVSYSDAQR